MCTHTYTCICKSLSLAFLLAHFSNIKYCNGILSVDVEIIAWQNGLRIMCMRTTKSVRF